MAERPPDVTQAVDALRRLLQYVEKLEEEVQISKMREGTLTDEETKNLDKALLEMEKGKSMSLDEFNKRRGLKVHGKSPS